MSVFLELGESLQAISSTPPRRYSDERKEKFRANFSSDLLAQVLLEFCSSLPCSGNCCPSGTFQPLYGAACFPQMVSVFI